MIMESLVSSKVCIAASKNNEESLEMTRAFLLIKLATVERNY